jgi:hypothetical protein
MKEKQKMEKIDRDFGIELNEISIKNTSLSGYKPSIRRLTKAIRRHSQWQKIKEDMINTKLEDDRWKDGNE